jgi:uncharacterized protein YndB with AHSA1/START domain
MNTRAEVRIERRLPAPVDDVFAAWVDPDSMARWFSPTGRAEVESDVVVGGGFRIVMLDDDTRIEHTGQYLVIDPPHVLSFTWISPYTRHEPSVVTIKLTPVGDATHLVLVHERLPRETADAHGKGWGTILDLFATALLSRDGHPLPAMRGGAGLPRVGGGPVGERRRRD